MPKINKKQISFDIDEIIKFFINIGSEVKRKLWHSCDEIVSMKIYRHFNLFLKYEI